MKGNPAKKTGSFTRYTGNLKSEGGSLPKPNAPTKKSGGKAKSNLKKTAVAKKLKGKS